MYKKLLFSIAVAGTLSVSSFAKNISESECNTKGNEYVFAGGECINFYKADGEKPSSLIIIVHGSWAEGTNTLGRYSPFADNLAMATDVTTIAVALPSYSGSSSNKLGPLIHTDKKPLSATKEYVAFLADLIKSLKSKYKAEKVTFVGHSAGAMMGGTVLGIKPELISNAVLVGGRYDIHAVNSDKSLISAIDVVDNISKNTKIALIYGTKDTISEPKVTKDFYNLAKSKGLNVTLVEVPNGEHLDLDMTDESVNAIKKLLE